MGECEREKGKETQGQLQPGPRENFLASCSSSAVRPCLDISTPDSADTVFADASSESIKLIRV